MSKIKTGRSDSGKETPSELNPVTKKVPDAEEAGTPESGADATGEPGESGRPVFRHPNRDSGGLVADPSDFRSQNAEEMDERHSGEPAAPEELQGLPTKEMIGALATYQAPHCVSIFLGTHKAGKEVNEKVDAISLKVMLQQLKEVLRNREMTDEEIEVLLQPALALVGDNHFWTQQSEGLALFIAAGYFRFLRLPFAPVDEAVCTSHFLVAPLLEVRSPLPYFYLLVLSKQQCRLYRGDQLGLQPVPVEGMPEGIAAVKRWSDKDASTFRVGGAGPGANYHGIGGGNPDQKTSLTVYFEYVDDLIFKEVLNRENVPLVLAGVEYLIPIYKSVCDYSYVWEGAVTGSYREEDVRKLHEKAGLLMAPYFDAAKSQALGQFAERTATDTTSSRADVVIPAAVYGRVDSLFIEKGAHLWGRFEPETETLTIHNRQEADSEEILDRAAAASLLNGGEVFLLERSEMPTQSRLAAVFRY